MRISHLSLFPLPALCLSLLHCVGGGVAPATAAPVPGVEIVAGDGAYGDLFGRAVGLADGRLIVGAIQDGPSGAAYVFDADTGAELGKLVPEDGAASVLFGGAVAISGTRVVVGAASVDDAGRNSGSAYVFDLETGAQIARLTAADAAADDYFGASVAISGERVLVGAYGQDANGTDSGAAYVFDAGTGTQLAKIEPDAGATNDLFGYSVALSGDRAIVGAFQSDAVAPDGGAAYVFDLSSGTQLSKLTSATGRAGDHFGSSVAIHGTRAVVGAPRAGLDEEDTGLAYLFDVATGELIATLLAEAGGAGDAFGFSVALSDRIAMIGAPYHDLAGPDAGAAYLFDIRTGAQLAQVLAASGGASDAFGYAVAVWGGESVAGAYLADAVDLNSGAAYLYDTSELVAVPLPAGGWLLGTGLVTLVLVRRKPGRARGAPKG